MELNYTTNLYQEQQQKQELAMTPKLQQAIKLLQYSTLELQEFIEDKMMENPLLELDDNYDPQSNNYIKQNGDDFNYEKFVAQELTLEEHLLKQLSLVTTSKLEKKIGEQIIGNLDQSGFFSSLEEVINQLEVTRKEVNKVLAKIKQFDPAGIGARDIQESLLIQLDNLKTSDNNTQIGLAKQIINGYQAELNNNQVRKISQGLSIEPKVTQQLIDLIKSLSPIPADRFKKKANNIYIEPDIIIKQISGKYVIIMDQASFPTIHINSYYRNLLKKQNAAKQSKDYIEDKLKSAMWLIKSIEQRRQTVYNIVRAIINLQQDFLKRGIKYLKPMTMQQIADEIKMHESTVSRATSNKYIQTPQGLFPMKFLFSKAIKTGDQKVSAVSIKKEVEDLVANEDKNNPLSDRELKDKLEARGVTISRRTIAKYRTELKIPSSRKRKRYD
ncbi:RNA polymerase sigma-54 factor [Halobacteroides halobius DSM 5150]|uniref:RNA polymerase sigma-54 factor n=1 Tax=Halobacteroides halobius (strain ATCC 35273 / DSM 5150 / MD-1) TaxID=748449 RepID=L0KAU7_HALHC|nr:RNA polymerase factor sigma-54 [Halobacteroides halobius]AGB42412.1 RNA polymerase sigma-54 factor [Halobacteroides halobius DSM 5150]